MTPLPPKQGLKQGGKMSIERQIECYDTTSTKTRIETEMRRKLMMSETCYDTTSTKTRIETG